VSSYAATADHRAGNNRADILDGTGVIFEEIDEDLGLRVRSRLGACEPFGVVRRSVIEDLRGEAVSIRYLDG